MPHDQLDVVFQAACSVGTSRFVVTADPHQVDKVKRELERILPEPVRAQHAQAAGPGYARCSTRATCAPTWTAPS